MQAQLKVYCTQCDKYLGEVPVDTADMPEDLQKRVNKVILAHRQNCLCYKGDLCQAVVYGG
jgi:hypothetical protein